MPKILVTGGAGFIGSHLVDALLEEGHQVVVVDNLSTGKKEKLNSQAKFYPFDIQDKTLEDIFKSEKPDFLFHEAAQIDVRRSVADPIFDAENNILASLNLLENSVKYKIKKFIFASTGGAIYGEADTIPTPENYPCQPLSPYGIAKVATEYYLYYYQQIHGLPYVALRYANVYGPRQLGEGEAGVVAIFTSKLLSGKQPIINGDGQQTRDYVYVADVVKANLLALAKGTRGIFNIGTGKETSVNELFKKITALTGKGLLEKYGPAKSGEQRRSCLDCTKTKQKLDWEATTSLDEGLLKTVEWFRRIT